MCWSEVKARLRFALPSSEVRRVGDYLEHSVLSPMVMRYSTGVRGIIAAYREVDVLKNSVVVDGISPFLRVSATALLLVFSPARGAPLVGVVTYVGEEFLGLKVYKSFYTVISRKNCPDGLRYHADPDDAKASAWVWDGPSLGSEQPDATLLAQPGTEICVGTTVQFVCTGMLHTSSGLFQVRGSLSDPRCRILATEPPTEVPSDPHGSNHHTSGRDTAWTGDEVDAMASDALLAAGDMLGDPLAGLGTASAPDGAGGATPRSAGKRKREEPKASTGKKKKRDKSA